MTKALLYAVAAVVDLIFAVITWQNGRVIMPAVLVLATLCFAAAAYGQARAARR